jgi:gliding motility-associated-like protein
VQLNSPSELILDLIPFDVRCIGDQNGSIIVSGSGGSNLTAFEFSLDSIRWQRGDIFPNLTTGVYTVYIRDYNGCVNSDTVSISASDPFDITFITPGDTTISYGDSITLSAMVSDSSSATVSWWNLYTNTVVVNGAYQTVQAPMNTIVYEFRAISPLGCEVDSSFRVMVNKQRSASAPAGFTPNGDGTNDSFFIQSDGKVSKIPVFRVFDRWGELVFEGVDILPNNPAQGWDGTFKNLPMNSGVYAWYAEIEYIDGHKEVIRGDVTLLR